MHCRAAIDHQALPGNEVAIDGEDLLIMKESDVMAIIETKATKKGKKAA